MRDRELDRGTILGADRDREPQLLAGKLESVEEVVGERVRARDRRAPEEARDDDEREQTAQEDRRRLAEQGERRVDAVGKGGSRRGERGEDRVAHPDPAGRVEAALAVPQAEGGCDGLAKNGVADLLEPPDPAGHGFEVLREVRRRASTPHQT